MKASININEFVWVKLTARGIEIYNRFCADHGLNSLAGRETLQGFLKFQLWNLMEIFGPNTKITGNPHFEYNCVYLTDPNH